MVRNAQARQEALQAAMQYFGMDPQLRYRTLVGYLPLDDHEMGQWSEKLYIQIGERAALVYRSTTGDWRVEEETQGFKRLLIEHL
jgi:hypothetical protein